MNRLNLFFTVLMLTLLGCNSTQTSICDVNKSMQRKAEELLSKMTVEEKVGQMTQITIDVILKHENNKTTNSYTIDTNKLHDAILKHKIGSIQNINQHAYTRGQWFGIQSKISEYCKRNNLYIPVLYGIDAIHGTNYTQGATLFPQQLGMAATWNPQLVEQAGAVSAYETRASYIPWNFSPVLDCGRNPLWSRIYETFGEDVFLVSTMGKAIIKGYQDDDISNKDKVATCLKHYMGYSFPLSGKDRTPAWIPENYLREYFLPMFADAVKSGAVTVMVNSAEINGTPVHADYHILTEILKQELNFKGFVVSDWYDIKNLFERHHIASSQKEAVRIAVMAGIDMSMVPYDYSFAELLLELVKEGKVPISRIDDAVKRILFVKFKLGLFEHPYYKPDDYPKFGSEEFRLTSYNTAVESITLLKNQNNVLPLKKDAKVLITGVTADNINYLNGGWSSNWQGTVTDKLVKDKATIAQAIQKKIGEGNVKLVVDSTFNSEAKIAEAVKLAKTVDYVILCLGENAYAETPGNIEDLYIAEGQARLAVEIAKTGKPVILVLAEGRPRLISKFEALMQAVVMAYLPGNEGGLAIADILFGDANPSGRLPITYPRFPNSLINYDHKFSENAEFQNWIPQYFFGFGLSYTTFEYSNFSIDKKEISTNDSLTICVDVTNKGNREGKEVVQLYISDLVASITPPVKRLRGFNKINLQPSETKKVTFKIATSNLAFVDRTNKWITEAGDYEVTIDKLKEKFVLK